MIRLNTAYMPDSSEAIAEIRQKSAERERTADTVYALEKRHSEWESRNSGISGFLNIFSGDYHRIGYFTEKVERKLADEMFKLASINSRIVDLRRALGLTDKPANQPELI
jgi:hypothetical protein